MLDSISVSRTYPQPIAKVWHALTDSDALAAWLMPNDFRPEVGHSFTFQSEPAPGFDGIVRCTVEAVEPEHHLAYTWRGGSLDTRVSFRLKPTADGGTKLDLVHSGFSGFANKLFIRNILAAGWRKLLPVKLTNYLNENG